MYSLRISEDDIRCYFVIGLGKYGDRQQKVQQLIDANHWRSCLHSYTYSEMGMKRGQVKYNKHKVALYILSHQRYLELLGVKLMKLAISED